MPRDIYGGLRKVIPTSRKEKIMGNKAKPAKKQKKLKAAKKLEKKPTLKTLAVLIPRLPV